jgi:maltose O-acetyltransferase
MKFKIGAGSAILMHCCFDAAKGFEMGTHSVINANCRIDTRAEIKVGNNVSISTDVFLITGDHDMNNNMQKRRRNNMIVIDDYVWIGTRAMVLPGVKINRGAVVAAGAVVTKNVGEKEVVAGVPAAILKKRADSFDYTVSYRRLFQ